MEKTMGKDQAIQMLGGTIEVAAKAIGISYQAVSKWPDVLPPRIADRVIAAYARKHCLIDSAVPEGSSVNGT